MGEQSYQHLADMCIGVHVVVDSPEECWVHITSFLTVVLPCIRTLRLITSRICRERLVLYKTPSPSQLCFV